jgi:prepilin-type N-terminal cleavage/methylation domain-containing protein
MNVLCRTDARSKSVGFTLVELMIVVVILGVLAAIAIPLYMKFVQQSKEGEAQINLGKIASLVEQHHAKTANQQTSATITAGGTRLLIAKFPNTLRTTPGSCATTPAINAESVPRAATSVLARSYQPVPNEWTCSSPAVGCLEDTAWSQLNFEISSPIRFVYCYESNTPDSGTQTFVVVASGNNDGDAMWSRFERRGQSGTGGAIEIGPVGVTNEGE